MEKISKDKIRAYALKNAIQYKGKANPGAIVSALFNEGLHKEDVKEIMPKIKEIVKEVSKLSLQEQEKDFEKFKDLVSERESREGLPELPNAENGVVMRFAPSASGALHVIHGVNACLNYNYVRKYGGKMYFRIEDTNPENIDRSAYNLIKKDADFLTKDKAKVIIQSDRMDIYYAYAVALIEKQKAYVCTCTGDDFRQYSKEMKECPCRKNTLKENVKKWEDMLAGKFKPGKVVLRFKSNMKDKNPAMRDFPLARVNLEEHPLQKNKYKVWPLMNLSVAADDIELGMTHIIRGKDHRDNAQRQKMIYEVFNKNYPWTAFLGRYHFKDMELSTSKFRKEIEQGKYKGWDDKRLPTVSSLAKRGYKPEAFWKLAEHIGLSEVDKNLDEKDFFRLLDEFNKE